MSCIIRKRASLSPFLLIYLMIWICVLSLIKLFGAFTCINTGLLLLTSRLWYCCIYCSWRSKYFFHHSGGNCSKSQMKKRRWAGNKKTSVRLWRLPGDSPSVGGSAVCVPFAAGLVLITCSPPSPVASWFISPLLSGLMSGLLFMLIRHFILSKVGSHKHA